MNDLMSRALLCGLGLASLTKDAIQKTAEDLVNQSKLSEEEGRRLVEDWQRRSDEAQKVLEEKVNSAIHSALKKLNLAAKAMQPKKTAKVAKSSKKSTKKTAKRRGTKKASGKAR
jgi:polyhydroxyalkanoate synthesis regulator phasin